MKLTSEEFRKMSRGEAALAVQLNRHLPGWVSQFRFSESRKWRFDFANPELKLAVEIDGGSGQQAHGQVWRREGDYDKRNSALIMGWRVLVFTTSQAERGVAIDYIRRVQNGEWPVQRRAVHKMLAEPDDALPVMVAKKSC